VMYCIGDAARSQSDRPISAARRCHAGSGNKGLELFFAGTVRRRLATRSPHGEVDGFLRKMIAKMSGIWSLKSRDSITNL
jgi:hypothetical protein